MDPYPSFEDWLKSEAGFAHYIEEIPNDDLEDNQILVDFQIDDSVAPQDYALDLFDLISQEDVTFPIVFHGQKLMITNPGQLIFLASLDGITYSENSSLNTYFSRILDTKPKLKQDFSVVFTHLLRQEIHLAVKIMIAHGLDRPFCCDGKDLSCVLTLTYQQLDSPIFIPDRLAPRDKGVTFSRN